MARRYQLEQPISRDQASQHLHGAQQRVLDKMATDLDTMETDVESYTPSTAGDWADPQPTTQDEALDRLAAAVAGLLTTPVP